MVLVTFPACAKEIREANIALTSACPMRCGYCFIDKDSPETMSLDNALRAAAFILSSPGRRKAIHLYGGEPLLRFDLVKAVISFSKAEAARLDKDFFPGICSNGTLLKREHLAYLRRERVHLSISLNGSRKTHDQFRRLKSGRGSFDLIARRLPEVFDALGAEGVTALMCVHPQAAGTMHEDFKNLASMGFRIINVEVIHGFPWTQGQKAAFCGQLAEIEKFAFSQAIEGNFLYVESFLRYVRGPDEAFEICPLHSSLCVFPDGRYTLYPHPFLAGGSSGSDYVIGDAQKGLTGRFQNCGFDQESEQCRTCARRYYPEDHLAQGSDIFKHRCRALKAMARKALTRAGGEPLMRQYVKTALGQVLRYQA